MELTAQTRTQFGKAVKTLRAKGLLPAELYGQGVANLHLAVPVKEFKKVFKEAGESTMIYVAVEGKKHAVIIQDVVTDPITDEVMSIDFYQVRLDQKLQVKVPIAFMGDAPAVKEKGGVLVKAMTELKVEALPTDIPHAIEVSLAGLNDIGVSIHVSELKVSANVKVLDEGKAVVATIIAKMTEEQEAKLAAEADVTTVKSETEEKVAARAAEKEASAPTEGAPAAPAKGAPAAKPEPAKK